MNIENTAMDIVNEAIEIKQLAFKALRALHENNIENAKKNIKKAEEKVLSAHRMQTDIIFKESDGEKVDVNVFLIHAQDHLMAAILAKDLVKEFVEIFGNK